MELGGFTALGFDVGHATDVGKQRTRNEDNHFVCDTGAHDISKQGLLFAVADGMGGHQGGALASKLAIETIGSYYGQTLSESSVDEQVGDLIRKANDAIRTRSALEPEFSRMGTTLTLAIFRDGQSLRLWHIGDCRAFLVREGTIRQVTNDHSLVADQLRLGIITREEAANHPAKNVITRALGTRKEVVPDTYTEEFKPGDRLMICCDGLHGVVPLDEILQSILTAENSREGCKRLVERANDLGGPDNITVILAHFQKPNGLWPWMKSVYGNQT